MKKKIKISNYNFSQNHKSSNIINNNQLNNNAKIKKLKLNFFILKTII